MDPKQPTGKGSRRRRFGDWMRNLVPSSTLAPPSRPGSQYSASSAALSTSAQPSPPDPPVHGGPTVPTQPAPAETGSKAGRPDTSSRENTNPSPEPTTTNLLKETKNVTWSALESTLRILETSASVFPPLESAIGGFIACLDIVQLAVSSREDYEELATELKVTVETLKPYVSKLDEQSPEVADLVSSIEAQVAHISKQRGRGTTRQLIESSQDKEDVIRCYRKMEKIFHQLQNLVVLRTWENTDKQRMDSLLQSLSPAGEAIYNSSYSQTIKRRACTKQTRELVQSDLQHWAQDPNGAKIYWMNGMAGTGKTTIAYSFCEWLEANSKLGASFFFSRASGSCDDITRLLPTISHQLARHSATFRSALLKLLNTDPRASELKVEHQFQKLLQEPMQEAKGSGALLEAVVVVIDALDECTANREIQLVLQMLLSSVKDLPIKFFVTSRPEYHITEEMKHLPTVIHLHDIEQSIVEEDIRKYLAEALSGMSRPPSSSEIAQLASHAGKLFIYAATVVRYIYPDRTRVDSRARLRTMLAVDSESSGRNEPGNKYKELDRLYTAVLAAAFSDDLEPEEMNSKKTVLWTIVCLREPLTTSAIAKLLEVTEDQVIFEVQSLQSVLHLSEKNMLVSTLHASFPDYMLARVRSNTFHCDQSYHSQLLAARCFTIMERQLRFNICRLDSSSIFDKSVPDLNKRIQAFISPELFYACRFWSGHLQTASPTEDLQARLVDFISCRLLFWMEVLNLQECRETGIKALEQAHGWLGSTTDIVEIQQQFIEAQDFATRFFSNACSRSTPQIYISALPSFGESGIISKCYRKRTRRLIEMKGTMINERGQSSMSTWVVGSPVLALALAPKGRHIAFGSEHTIRAWDAHTGKPVSDPFEGHTDPIYSVAYSSDSSRIVSGSGDGTLRVWDAHAGSPIAGPFEGHTDWVRSVSFSPDGARIASGSDDCTIRVWDAHTGKPVSDPFEGHTDPIYSVAYSSDSSRIVSGSGDGTLRVWDAHAGSPIAGPFEGHTGSVRSVSFSPDGARIASGSDDRTIRVWDAHTGKSIADPFEGHTFSVHSVAYSPDGTCIASGSVDDTVRVWDAHTGSLVAGPFMGHTDNVNSVKYSPDGRRIVSGSKDRTIRVWNTRLVMAAGDQSEGHTDCVKSVALSPDGMHVSSGSDDGTIRVWDAHTGRPVAGPFEGHAGYINSIAYSPNGTHIASGSSDKTIRVWDANTGKPVGYPFGGHTATVRSMVYSPDGTRIVSGSDDRSIRVWDAHTGTLVADPLVGHTDSVNSVAYSPDGAHIASGSQDKTIRVWDSHTSQPVFDPFVGHTDSVNSVTYSPDGTHIVSGSSDRTIRVWNAHTGNLVVGPFEGHTGSINSVAYSTDGSRIVSGSSNHTILVWDSHTGNVVAGPFGGATEEIHSVIFTPAGTHVISGFGSISQSRRSCGIRVLQVCPPLTQPAPLLGTWSFQPDGWITADDVPLFWCSPELHDYLPRPWESLVIGPRGSIQVDYSQSALGENWADCFITS